MFENIKESKSFLIIKIIGETIFEVFIGLPVISTIWYATIINNDPIGIQIILFVSFIFPFIACIYFPIENYKKLRDILRDK